MPADAPVMRARCAPSRPGAAFFVFRSFWAVAIGLASFYAQAILRRIGTIA
jgi:hypothetical protein